MSEITTLFVTLTKMVCPHCGGIYAMSQEYLNEAYEKGQFKQCWSCPYCKESRGYGDGKIQQLQRESEQLQRQLANERANVDYHAMAAEHFRKSRDAVSGHLTRVKKRVAHGVCPCCKRTFSNLARHMNTKHPSFAGKDDKS